jgi:alkanesulfonate monooxygenase SsuD/methylene tetrahydromethanopterin reductase-like flavin-dependent oxidoreductase (luciferase family)
LAARWADEYNTGANPVECGRRRRDALVAWRAAGRDENQLVFSVLLECIVGRDAQEVRERAAIIADRRGALNADAVLDQFMVAGVAGTPEEVAERLQTWAMVGVDRVFLLHPLADDLETIELLGAAVIPALAAR